MNDIKLAMFGNKEAAKRLAEMRKPVPCPWCRGMRMAVKDGIWPQIMCEQCGARGPRATTTFEAMVGWNTRVEMEGIN